MERPMRITKLECLHADAGFRNFDFLKISTDEGVVGWSEYNESFGRVGVTSVIENLFSAIVGKDPRPNESLVARMYAIRRQASGGIAQQAVGAMPRDVECLTSNTVWGETKFGIPEPLLWASHSGN
jgi:galactonate dehydratase